MSAGKENVDASFHADAFDKRPVEPVAAPWSPIQSTQETAMSSQPESVFSPPRTQSTQPTQSFKQSFSDEEEKQDTGDSFVSANEAFANKNAFKDNARAEDASAMDVEDADDDNNNNRVASSEAEAEAEGTMIHHELDSEPEQEDADMQDLAESPEQPPLRVVSEQYSISAETHEALDTANDRALAPEPKNLFAPEQSTTPAGLPPTFVEAETHDDTMVHHDVDDQMDVDDDVRSPSENSSPVKPLVRKSSLTFASLPAREPLPPKKSMGNRMSRTSHVDPSKARNSHLGTRFTGGKSLGGSQIVQSAEAHDDEDQDLEMERPGIQREESETTKVHNKTSTQRLFERINMLKQQNEAPKRISQNILSSQASQPQSVSSTQPKEDVMPVHASYPEYPSLPPPEVAQEEDDDDDWISPVRTTAPAPKPARPIISKSQTAEVLQTRLSLQP
jgi:hypothetical protein